MESSRHGHFHHGYMPVWQCQQAPILLYCVIPLNGPLGTDVIAEKHVPEDSLGLHVPAAMLMYSIHP